MSQENVEVVRRWHTAMTNIDPGGIADVVAELWDVDGAFLSAGDARAYRSTTVQR